MIFVNKVEGFLKHFQSPDNTEEVFTNDCCYWFALILFRRFIKDGAKIMYDIESEYFGTEINGKVYDITGDITNNYNWIPWDSIDDFDIRYKIVSRFILI